VFLPVVRFGFVNFDDADYVTNNPAVKRGLTIEGLQWAFATFHASNWHPLTWISHMADCTLFGLSAGAHHGVNILFHAVNVALLFTLLRQLTGRIWPTAFVAALFAWHPLHVESVAWISERKDVLSTLFGLLALLSYTYYAQSMTRGRAEVTSGTIPSPNTRHLSRPYWLALGFFVLGLLAKPMLVTLPFVMLLLDGWPLQRVALDRWQGIEILGLVREKIPFFLLSAASCAVTFVAQRHGDAVISLTAVPLGHRLENAAVAIVSYLGRLLWPVNLCAYYPMPEKIPALQVVLAVILLLLISAAAWHWRQSRPFGLIGWLWFLGTLVPVIGLVQVGGQAMADRYTYLPSIGIFLALVFLAAGFVERLQTPEVIRFGLAGLIAIACILVTEHQLPFWRDSEALFRRADAVTKNNDLALLNLGVALNMQGRFEEALAAYRRAEAFGSQRYQIYNNLGNVLRILDRPAESLAEYRKAIQLNPGNAALHRAAANQLAALHRYDNALAEFAIARQLNPNDATLHLDAAKVLFKIGLDTDGVAALWTALRIEPDNFTTLATIAHYLAANENTAARDGTNALILALKADELSGHMQPMVMDILGMAYADNDDFTNAMVCARNALELANAVQMQNIAPLQSRLERYQTRQPWRESFRVTNALEKP
jgi:Flp pilus assembly protein TadD